MVFLYCNNARGGDCNHRHHWLHAVWLGIREMSYYDLECGAQVTRYDTPDYPGRSGAVTHINGSIFVVTTHAVAIGMVSKKLQ